MSTFEQLQNLFPKGLMPDHGITSSLQFVKYGVQADIDFDVDNGQYTENYTRNRAAFYNSATFCRKVRCQQIDDVGNSSGYNREVISPTGRFNLQMFSALQQDVRLQNNDTMAMLAMLEETYLAPDNMVGFLYNLQRMYYSKLQKDTNYAKDKYWYKNGHLAIKYGAMFEMIAESHRDGIDLRWDLEPCPIYSGNVANFQLDDMVCVRYNGVLKDGWAEVLASCQGPIRGNTDISFMHSSPSMNKKLYISTEHRFDAQSCKNLDDITLLDLKTLIMTFVKSNRLYADFDAAYLMLVQVMCAPVPRSAEAAIWYAKPVTVNQPRAGCYRGIHRLCTQDLEYEPTPGIDKTFFNWSHNPTILIWHSALFNESVNVELFNYQRQRNDMYARGDFSEPIDTESGVMFDMAQLGARHECDFTCMRQTFGGMYRLSSFETIESNQEVEVTQLTNLIQDEYDVRYSEDRKWFLKIANLTPLVYPIMTLGLAADDYYMNALTYESKMDVARDGSLTTTSLSEAVKMLNITRLMGYDVTAEDLINSKYIKNWADNGSGRFLYLSSAVSDMTAIRIQGSKIVKRAYSWGHIGNYHNYLKIKINIKPKSHAFYYNNYLQRNMLVNLTLEVTKPDEYKSNRMKDLAGVTKSVVVTRFKKDMNQGFHDVNQDAQQLVHIATTVGSLLEEKTQVVGEIPLGMNMEHTAMEVSNLVNDSHG